MKNQIFMTFGLLLTLLFPSVHVAHAQTNPSLTVDIQGDYVSFDDITTALNGTMTLTEDGRTYLIKDQTFWLDHGKGYSLVNNQPEPFLVETSLINPKLFIVSYTKPILFNDELFVPIGYVERLLSLSYVNGDFEQDGELVIKGEIFVETDQVDSSTSEKSESTSTPEVNVIEKNPTSGEVSVQKPNIAEKLTVKRIFVNQSRVTVQAGEAVKVNAVVDPFNVEDATISWSSENTDIATVDNKGRIQGIKEGIVTLTVQSNMNPSVKSSVVVTVTPPPVVFATSIHVDKASLSLEVGQTSKVSAWVSPDNTTDKGIKWSSENSSVVTVDGSGTITAKGEGSTRLVATSTSNPELKTHVSITVKAKPVVQPAAPAPAPEKVETPQPTPQPEPQPTPQPEPQPTPQPTQPIYTGNQVISQLLNEGFTLGTESYIVYWSPYGNQTVAELYDVEVAALNGMGGLDIQLRFGGHDWDNMFTYGQKALNKIIPSGTSTIINALKAGQSGTWTFDGRTVKVYYNQHAYVTITPKY